MPPPLPLGLPLQMLERRPDVIAAERRVAAAFNRVGQAKAARLPQITLNLNFGAFESEVLELQGGFRESVRRARRAPACADLPGRCAASAGRDPHAAAEGSSGGLRTDRAARARRSRERTRRERVARDARGAAERRRQRTDASARADADVDSGSGAQIVVPSSSSDSARRTRESPCSTCAPTSSSPREPAPGTRWQLRPPRRRRSESPCAVRQSIESRAKHWACCSSSAASTCS